MNGREVQELRERLIEALADHGIVVLPELAERVADALIATVEWEAIIITDEEWADVLTMRRAIFDLAGIARAWDDNG